MTRYTECALMHEDSIAGRYEASRPGYPAHVVEFVTTTAGLGPGVAVL